MKIYEIDIFNYKHINKFFSYFQKKYKEDSLIFTSHYPVFTIGRDEKDNFNMNVTKSDRGGSITYFDEGVLMVYFVFKVVYPAKFYKNVITAFINIFNKLHPQIYYNKKAPGFYIQNRKIASLGFRYQKGFSKHGVAVNIEPNLKNFNKINPCNLKGVTATSLKKEKINIPTNELKNLITNEVKDVFKT